jgi:hypothetical protein
MSDSFFDRFALIVSAVTSPFIVIPCAGIFVVSAYAGDLKRLLSLGGAFLLFVVIAPLAYVLNGIVTKRLTDIHVTERDQRTAPLVVSSVSAFALIAVYKWLLAPDALVALSVIVAANGIVFLLITHYWKVSVHVAAVSASVLLVTFLIDRHLCLLGILVPMVIWSRVRRRRHDILQGIMGALVVTLVTIIVLVQFRLI